MKSYKIVKAGEPLELAEEETPTPSSHEVLIKVKACGVCHSDLHLHEGFFDLGGGKKLPMSANGLTMGHEIMGEVAAIGDAVTGVKVGDKRVVYPWIGCGSCSVCQAGDEHICSKPQALGIAKSGGYSDYVLVPGEKYLFDYGDTDQALAATYACSGLTAYSAVKRVKDSDGDLVIIGAGGVGMMAVQIAVSIFGIAPIVVDIDDDKLAAAKAVGAKAVVNSSTDNAVAKVFELTGSGAANAIDFVGAEATATLGTKCIRKGGIYVIVGLFGGELKMPLPLIPMMERGIQGSYVGNLENMAELMVYVREGKIPAIPVDTRPMDKCNDTLIDLKQGKIVGRAVLVNA